MEYKVVYCGFSLKKKRSIRILANIITTFTKNSKSLESLSLEDTKEVLEINFCHVRLLECPRRGK